MKSRIVTRTLLAACLLAAAACNSATSTPIPQSAPMTDSKQKELIVLAAPPDGDKYYANVSDDIFDFHIAYAKQILAHDDVLILSGKDRYDDYVKELGEAHVAPLEMQDIWMRDFTLSNAANPVMFRYTAAGQGGGARGQREADFVQKAFARALRETGTEYKTSTLRNDGGNLVDDYEGNIVISRKFLRDNRISENLGRDKVKTLTGASNVAFIEADEQGGLEHADGVAAFIGKNVLVINSYPEDQAYSDGLKTSLRAGLPGVKLHEIITPYDGSEIYDERFGSACGLYTNMLVTPDRIYFPQFGIPQDKIALKQISGWTSKKIVPVQSGGVCKMGGGVRCMSWQLRGDNAQKLLNFVNSK